MDAKTVEAAIGKTSRLLKAVEEPWKSLAFPVLLERSLEGGNEASEVPPKARTRASKGSDKKPTRSAMLRRLISEGWFKTQRGLADVRKELKNRGLPTKNTTLPSLVLPLVLEGKLKRKPVQQGKKELYVYFA